jgi:hypothetical protein
MPAGARGRVPLVRSPRGRGGVATAGSLVASSQCSLHGEHGGGSGVASSKVSMAAAKRQRPSSGGGFGGR